MNAVSNTNRWAQATLRLSSRHAEAVSEALMEAGALSVSIEDALADSEDEQPLFGEPGMEPEKHRGPITASSPCSTTARKANPFWLICRTSG